MKILSLVLIFCFIPLIVFARGFEETKKLAEQGNAHAQIDLGSMYLEGIGVPLNYIKAYLWFSLAKAQGNVVDADILSELSKKMTPEQIAQAQKEAAEIWEQLMIVKKGEHKMQGMHHGERVKKDIIAVQEYYSKAKSIDHFIEGIKVIPFLSRIRIKSKFGKFTVASFGRGEFTDAYFGNRLGDDFKKVFKDGGINPNNLTSFLNNHKNQRAVALYKDGFMVLYDDHEKNIYIFPIGKDVAQKINDL